MLIFCDKNGHCGNYEKNFIIVKKISQKLLHFKKRYAILYTVLKNSILVCKERGIKMAFLESIKNASITLEGIFAYLKNMVAGALADSAVVAAIDQVKALLSPVWAYRFYAVMVLALIVALFGKRIYGLLKFLGGFAAGFCAGVVLLAPMVTFLPPWVVGVVVGLVAALLIKFLYYVAVIAGVGYAAYFCAYSATYLDVVFNYTKGNILYSAIVAAVAIILVLLLLKWIEMLGTSVLGGYVFTLALVKVFDIRTIGFLSGLGNISLYIVMGLVALVGFVVQVKTRKRY